MAFFDTKEELLNSAHIEAISQGQALVTTRSTDTSVYLECARNHCKKKPRLICPYLLCGSQNGEKWKLEVIHTHHKHYDMFDLMGPTPTRYLSDDQIGWIESLLKIEVKPPEILQYLQVFDRNTMAIPEDILKVRELIEKENNAPYEGSPIEELVRRLKAEEWEHEVYHDGFRVTRVVFADRASSKFARKHNALFLTDSQYYDNCFDCKFLHIVTQTPYGRTLSAAFCVLMDESTESYEWALAAFKSLVNLEKRKPVFCTDLCEELISAISSQFPESQHLLCSWRVNRAVNLETRAMVRDREVHKNLVDKWMQLTNSVSEEQYNEHEESLKILLQSRPGVMRHLQDTWLKHKSKFVVAWTNKHLHFGNASRRTVDTTHLALKRKLGIKKPDLIQSFRRISAFLHSQLEKLTHNSTNDDMSIWTMRPGPLFEILTRKLSGPPLFLIEDQLKRLTDSEELVACTNSHRNMMGVPCAHQLKSFFDEQKAIPLELVDPFWHTKNIPLPEPKNPRERVKRRKTGDMPITLSEIRAMAHICPSI